MENASQALLIAGGVLLGILTVSLLVYMFSTISTVGNASAMQEENKKLVEWNAEWEAYNKRFLYGTEVLTVINKAAQNNVEYDDSDEAYKVKIIGKDISGQEISVTNFKNFVENHKTSVFTCENVEYSDVRQS